MYIASHEATQLPTQRPPKPGKPGGSRAPVRPASLALLRSDRRAWPCPASSAACRRTLRPRTACRRGPDGRLPGRHPARARRRSRAWGAKWKKQCETANFLVTYTKKDTGGLLNGEEARELSSRNYGTDEWWLLLDPTGSS